MTKQWVWKYWVTVQLTEKTGGGTSHHEIIVYDTGNRMTWDDVSVEAEDQVMNFDEADETEASTIEMKRAWVHQEIRQ